MNIKDRVAIVTGSGSGIGKGIITLLAEKGAKVVVFDSNGDAASQAAQEIRQSGREAMAIQGDVTKSADVENLAQKTIEKYGCIDILVNNAGVLRDNLILNMPEEDFDFVINVNLKGYWLVSKAVLKYMKEQQFGRIVNISSRAWLGNAGQSNYSASKGGVVSLTRVLALEFARFSITVNCIAPGFIDTPLTLGLEPKIREIAFKSQLTPIIGQPEDIAYATLFLVTEEARWITGQVIHVDGGRSLGARNI
ncbi:MAG TPA: beta-ketoacyl-ACP reductase [Desulfotomaculum sp.]|nr:beta-ketoacyl-ACP reductase [Desulfotomaculum sp.]